MDTLKKSNYPQGQEYWQIRGSVKATVFLQYKKQRYVHAVICFLFVKFLPKVVLANALEKAGTGAFSDSGADLIPEILKFELKLTLKLTLRLI